MIDYGFIIKGLFLQQYAYHALLLKLTNGPIRIKQSSRAYDSYSSPKPTIECLKTGTSKCIVHIFTNTVEAVLTPIGSSDHNIVAMSGKANVSKAVPKIVHKTSYKRFCRDSYVEDVEKVCWPDVCNEEHPDAALDGFMKLFLAVINKHAPIKKLTVKAPWIDEE